MRTETYICILSTYFNVQYIFVELTFAEKKTFERDIQKFLCLEIILVILSGESK